MRTQSTRVDPSNLDQARAWDGDEGSFWASHAARFDRAVAAYHQPFLDAAAFTADDLVLDIGCGTGKTTRDAARVASRALGVDLSRDMLDVARNLATAEGLANIRFEQADAQIHPFEQHGFDVVISRTGSMFFGDPVAAFANIGRALRPGGRLVLMTWRSPERNEWIQEIGQALAAAHPMPSPPTEGAGPFSLSRPEHVSQILSVAGFKDIAFEARAEPMYFGADPTDAVEFILGLLGWMLPHLTEAERTHVRAALTRSAQTHDTDLGVAYGSATWIVTARRP